MLKNLRLRRGSTNQSELSLNDNNQSHKIYGPEFLSGQIKIFKSNQHEMDFT